MVLRLVLGTVYTGMAAGQLASFEAMPGILESYQLVGGAGATLLAVLLIAGELVCGLWFLARPRSKAPAPVATYTAVSLVWTTLAVQAYVRGLTVGNCGCFGVYLTQELGLLVLLQDALTLVYAAVLLRSVRRARAGRPGESDVGGQSTGGRDPRKAESR